jgi:catecholate siderophore receptor
VVAGLELTNEKQTNYTYVNGAAVNGSAVGLPPTSIYHPNPNTPISKAQVNMVRNGAAAKARPTPRACTCSIPSSSASVDLQRRRAARPLQHQLQRRHGTGRPRRRPSRSAPCWQLAQQQRHLLNGKLSALYKPTDNSSVYALAATSKAPPGGKPSR